VITVTPSGLNIIITDSALDAASGGTNFDLYAWYNPHDSGSLGIQPTSPGLIGAQVYFFRMIADDRDVSRPTLVADSRVISNTQRTMTFVALEINYHAGATAIEVTDHYTVSPVIMQVVGAPLDVADFPGSGIDQSGEIESLGVYIRNRKGVAASGAVRLPSTDPMQGALFLGVATRANLEDRTLGKVVAPEVHLGQLFRMGSAGEAETELWDEASMDVVTVPIGKRGNSLFPVFTCYGANYQFDLVHLQGRVTRTGRVSGEQPEGY
jgi:hypothetical protein